MILREGFWARTLDLSDDRLPAAGSDEDLMPLAMPIHSSASWYGKRIFLRALAKVEDAAKDTNMVQYRGSSMCRCCGKLNGSSEFQVAIGGGHAWHWPNGFVHYIEVHNVRPSQAFIDFILDYASHQ